MRPTIKRSLRVMALAVLAGFAIASAKAEDLQLWRHGIVEAKSDAGIVFMGSKGGFAEKQGLKLRRKSGFADGCGLAGC